MSATPAPAVALITAPTAASANPPRVVNPDAQRQILQGGVQGAKARIDSMFGKDSEFAQILHQKLDLKGQDAQRVAGLGGRVSLDKMNQMLDKFQELKQRGLSAEHIQAVFIAGFVKGGVEGVLRFIGDGKAEHLQKDGFEKMQNILESDYKRSVLFVRKQGFFTNLDPVFKKIFPNDGSEKSTRKTYKLR